LTIQYIIELELTFLQYSSETVLRGRYTRMCSICFTKVQHSKNYFTQDKTTQVVFITKKRNVLAIKRRISSLQHRFYIFSILQIQKKKLYCLKIHYFKL